MLDQEYTRAEAARSLELNPKLMTRWMKEYQADDSVEVFRGNGKLTPEQAAIRWLKEAHNRLKREKDGLKKATGFFAKETNEVFVYHSVQEALAG